MKKFFIQIPEGILHLSDYSQLQNQFPHSSFILDKKVTGCGATTMFLRDSIPTILCSPRKELMYCKAHSREFRGRVHLFRDENDDKSISVQTLEDRMINYINQCGSPFGQLTPKVIVTYDSFKHVTQKLAEMGMLNKFRIVVDEAQALFTDASFKGGVEMEFLTNLSHYSYVIYLSATPYIENYLDQIDAFNQLPYVELLWPESAVHAANIEKRPYLEGSPTQTAKKIIMDFQQTGYFKNKLIRGAEVESHEAVFFLNNVSLIIRIINAVNDEKVKILTPDNTNIICADDDKNVSRLKDIGFSIGHAPGKGELHKTFTFVTRCSFEGTDFYSTCAYTYIFSDVRVTSMAYDISMDLPQIMGRQRREDNPFRYDASFFYKTLPEFSDAKLREQQNRINEKCATTNDVIEDFGRMHNQRSKDNMLKKYRSCQNQCKDDYITVVDDQGTNSQIMTFNYLAMYNEIRAWEIQKGQYLNGCQVMRAVNDATKPLPPEICQFLEVFGGDFEQRMSLYCDFLSYYPNFKVQLEELPQISMSIKKYYNFLGPDELRAQSYVEANIQNKIRSLQLKADKIDRVAHAFVSGQFYTNEQVKSMLDDIYNELGIKETAVAKDLQDLISCHPRKLTDKNDHSGKRNSGYEIN